MLTLTALTTILPPVLGREKQKLAEPEFSNSGGKT